MPAHATQQSVRVERVARPHEGVMTGPRGMTQMARIPVAAACKPDRKHVVRTVVVLAARLGANGYSLHTAAVYAADGGTIRPPRRRRRRGVTHRNGTEQSNVEA